MSVTLVCAAAGAFGRGGGSWLGCGVAASLVIGVNYVYFAIKENLRRIGI